MFEFFADEKLPEDYHCNCSYCQQFKYVIKDKDKQFFNCRDRTGYMKTRMHIAKTPRYIATWAVSQFTETGDWVFDPTIGSGTTGVEAKKLNRHVVGIELNRQWAELAAANCQRFPGRHVIINGDIMDYVDKFATFKILVQLIVSNPPYSGDENVAIRTDEDGEVIDRTFNWYDADKRNLAKLKENEKYYQMMGKIYNNAGRDLLKPGGYLVIGVKDMIRYKAPYMLHRFLANMIHEDFYKFVGMYLLPHWPRTLFMNTYPKWYPGVKVPFYQTILVWRKR